MNLTSKRKIAVIIAAMIITVVVTSVTALMLINLNNSTDQKDDVPTSGINITVSGTVDSIPFAQPALTTSLQTIEFTDTQTGANVTFHFPFPAHSDNPVGNYTVTLQDGHTYSVDLTYYIGPTIGGMASHTDNLRPYTVQAPTGTTSITQDFP